MPQQKVLKIGLSNADKQNMAQEVYERLLDLTFAEYDTSATYGVGDFVVYNNQLYKCIGATSGAWDSTKWQLATLNDLLVDIEDAVQFVNDKANVDGYYPTMTVGLAENLDTELEQDDDSIYLFRTAGGNLEIGDYCKEKAIVGGSLGFNQLANNGDFSNGASGWFANQATFTVENGVGTITSTTAANAEILRNIGNITSGHKYLVLCQYYSTDTRVFQATLAKADWSSYTANNRPKVANAWSTFGLVLNPQFDTNAGYIHVYPIGVTYSVGDSCQIKNVMFIDLTAMFGSTIADYIYNLEQATAGAGVAWFKRYFNKPYYPYTPIGGFAHVKTSGKKVVGFNQWDEETELGWIAQSNGENSANSNYLRSKNYIKVLPETVYYIKSPANIAFRYYDANKNFIGVKDYNGNEDGYDVTRKMPSNASYMRFVIYQSYGTTYNHDICINFHYDGERDGEYEPYESETYPNDNIELIGIPKIDSQGNLYFEGNRYNADGSVENKYGIVDLGTLNYAYESSPIIRFLTTDLSNLIKKEAGLQNVLCALYKPANNYNENKTLWVSGGGNMSIHDDSYTDAATFKAAMSGVYLIYELDTPTQSSATPFQEAQQVDNWGTEERIDNREIPVPVGHETEYLTDLKSKLEILPNLPHNDGTYVVNVASGVGEYAPIGAWLSANGWIKLTDISGYDNTKTQSLKNVNGTLTWVDD